MDSSSDKRPADALSPEHAALETDAAPQPAEATSTTAELGAPSPDSAPASKRQRVLSPPRRTPLPAQSEVAPGGAAGASASSGTGTGRQRIAPPHETLPVPVSTKGHVPLVPVLPKSLGIATGTEAEQRIAGDQLAESDVGIVGYVGSATSAGFQGVIKQRFADFLVSEVGLDNEVVRLVDISAPPDPNVAIRAKEAAEKAEAAAAVRAELERLEAEESALEPLPEALRFDPMEKWSTATTRRLRTQFADETIVELHTLFAQGRDWVPAPSAIGPSAAVSEAGAQAEGQGDPAPEAGKAAEDALDEEALANGEAASGGGRGRDRGRGRGRGRDGRGGGRGGRGGVRGGGEGRPKDERKVLSQIMESKEQRGAAHALIRELFDGVFESGTANTGNEGEGEGTRLAISYARGGKGQWNRRSATQNTKSLPPFIHFTLQKTNRETQDAIGHLARLIPCHVKDLTVAGTKDKRAITVQRVCLRRGTRTLDQVWRGLNGVKAYGHPQAIQNAIRQATSRRGDRGCRVGDFKYDEQMLELGQLNGNRFGIVLRNVQTKSLDDIDSTLSSLRDHGFINFYGMQRFGTGSVPTHLTGLHILRGEWTEAVDTILSLREHEHPDCVRGRLAWLDDGDAKKALELMPRRCVSERSIWEHWKRNGGASTDKVGALGSIPRNMRTMYVHAYQSYIWNCVVSKRVQLNARDAIVGDLVILPETAPPEPSTNPQYRGRPALATSSSQDVKVLDADDIASGQYSIFDVVMPLPGYDVEYPGGEIGEMYGKMMAADGLDHTKMRRSQREYSLPGSYRHIVHKPAHLTWRIQRYSDTRLPLIPNDEDSILGINPPAPFVDARGGEATSAEGSGAAAAEPAVAVAESDKQGATTTANETAAAAATTDEAAQPREEDQDPTFLAVVLDIQLSASVYATMALREVTRAETASWYQTNLTVEGDDQGYRGWGKGAGAEVGTGTGAGAGGEGDAAGVRGDEGEGEGEGAEEEAAMNAGAGAGDE